MYFLICGIYSLKHGTGTIYMKGECLARASLQETVKATWSQAEESLRSGHLLRNLSSISLLPAVRRGSA